MEEQRNLTADVTCFLIGFRFLFSCSALGKRIYISQFSSRKKNSKSGLDPFSNSSLPLSGPMFFKYHEVKGTEMLWAREKLR